MRFDFRVENSDRKIVSAQSLSLPDVDSAWSEVVEIAQGMDDIGGRIAVKDENGKVVILVDVVEIICPAGASATAKPTLILRALAAQ